MPSNDPLGKQASDMLATRLVASQQFLVFERPDLDKVAAEKSLARESALIGVDTLIIGSVTEFGAAPPARPASSTKIQNAHAKVEIRLVDVRTAYVFFTARAVPGCEHRVSEIAGFGSRADYDEALNDRAIGAAISDVENSLIAKLQQRTWRTDILKVEGGELYISGGKRQGLKVGDTLAVMQQGERVKSAQTGFDITLPPKAVGQIRVVVSSGTETNEGPLPRYCRARSAAHGWRVWPVSESGVAAVRYFLACFCAHCWAPATTAFDRPHRAPAPA
jgi:hypothetical protein